MTRAALLSAALFLSACVIPGTDKAACADNIQGKLKDPDSLKIISFEHTEENRYSVRYSATNSFGARVSNTITCAVVGDFAVTYGFHDG